MLAVGGERVASLAELFRRVWALGAAGVEVPWTVLQKSGLREPVVHSADRYDQLRGVSLSGTAELVREPEKVHALALEVMSRNTPGVSKEQLRVVAQKMASKRTGVVVKPTRIVSWDHSKLGGVGL